MTAIVDGFCLLLFFSPAILMIIDIGYFRRKGRRIVKRKLMYVEWTVLVAPCVGLFLSDWGVTNDCCGTTATFSAEHRTSVFVLMVIIGAAYFYSSYRVKLAPPILEILVNCLLLTGVVLDVLIFIQVPDGAASLTLTIPVLVLLLLMLKNNHQLALQHLPEWTGENRIARFCRYLLLLRPLAKYPLLLICCLPMLMLLVGLLMLFGQKPDALIRAFTDTYKQGFSQLNDQCNGVVCNQGHFLCTIAANGHGALVRPIRSGIRGGIPIKCNRQLLISNAFEELLEQRMPAFHRIVRNSYNKVGDSLDRYYGLYDHKWISDTIYILMKPLEWIFLLVLYTFDQKPENRIAQQYLSPSDRKLLRQKEKN